MTDHKFAPLLSLCPVGTGLTAQRLQATRSAAYSRVWVAAVLYKGLPSLLFRCWKLLMR